jgi:thiamine pyrophosphate-dependent acetolactate synthase large subunit-like protein
MAATTSDLIIERLLAWGIDTCFGINGDQINGFFESLRTHATRMRFVHVRHEEAAALAAVGYAKFTGRPAAVVATAGPGAIHLLNGVYDARIDGVPMIAITGLSYHDTIGTHLIQDLPSDRLFAAACPYSERVMAPMHAAAVTDQAVRSALMNRTPSHLAIPIDVQSQTEDADTASPKNVPHHLSLAGQPFVVEPPAAELERAADVLNRCQRVAICAGAGARGAGDTLEQVADVLGAPIVKTALGKDAVPDDSPFVTGGMGLIGTRPAQQAMEDCDGFLIVGSATPYAEFWPKPGQARGVQIDLNADRIGLRYPVEVGLVGNADVVLRRLLPLLSRTSDRGFLERAQRDTAAWWDRFARQADDPGTPMRPQVVTWQLSEALPDDAIVTGDAGSVTMWSARLRLRRGMNYSFSGTLCTMGSAIPYAIGAQLAHPDRPVVAFAGDGAVSMGLGELATIAKYQLPITVVVLRNDTLALEIWEQNALLGNPQYGCDLSPIDFAKVAEACGMDGYRLDDPSRAAEVLRTALKSGRPALVEAIVDPHETPFADTVKPNQAQSIIAAYDAGERDREPMARNMSRPDVRSMSPGIESVTDDLGRFT